MRQWFSAVIKRIGPGIITGASDDDPAGIATYAQTGATVGFGLLWTQVLLLPFMVAVQELASRIALVTKRGIAANIRLFSPKLALVLSVSLLLANSFNIGADINMMAATLELVFPLHASILISALLFLIVCLEIFLDYRTFANILKWFVLSLTAYIAVLAFIHVPWNDVIQSILAPRLNITRESLYLLVACIGTTISPYLYFWQAGEEIEYPEATGMKHGLLQMRSDTIIGMTFSNIIALGVMITAAVLTSVSASHIQTPAQLAQLLEPIAGRQATVLFVIGIVSSGLLAIPVLAGSAGYALGESLGWGIGIRKKWYDAKGFYLIIIFSTMVGYLLSTYQFDPIGMLVNSAVINAIIAVPSLVALWIIGNSRALMGRYKSHWLSNGTVLFAIGLLCFSVIAMGMSSFLR